MVEMLTAKDVQEILHVDRSTVYRMAEAGRLPAIKVGKQWRFPADRISDWLGAQISAPLSNGESTLPAQTLSGDGAENNNLAAILPLECVQLIQDSHADLLGVMLVITDMDGNPITRVSHPCGLFTAVSKIPNALQKCIKSWHNLGTALELEPRFQRSHLGLLCARGLIRVGTELQGMVVAGCVAPDEWPPAAEEVQSMATELGVEPALLYQHLDQAFYLDSEQRAAVLSTVQRVANIVAHIVNERRELVTRLEAIASLTKI